MKRIKRLGFRLSIMSWAGLLLTLGIGRAAAQDLGGPQFLYQVL